MPLLLLGQADFDSFVRGFLGLLRKFRVRLIRRQMSGSSELFGEFPLDLRIEFRLQWFEDVSLFLIQMMD